MNYQKLRPEPRIKPKLIIHGGAGNILPSNLPPEKYKLYHYSLLRILANTHYFLTSPSAFPFSKTSSSTSALDAATFAVTQLEDNPLFNCGHGAVFTRDGINELEASVMVSRGKKKRGVGVMGLQHVKNPIKLAREMLLHGETDLEGGNGEGPRAVAQGIGAQGHCQLHKSSAEELAREWGLEMVEPKYYFTQNRWDEHIRGLEREKSGSCATWSAEEFFPQGTVGAVALDAQGVIAVATSTGGITNKLNGRVGDTPTLGAGFWAEEWEDVCESREGELLRLRGPALVLSDTLRGLLLDCLPSLNLYSLLPTSDDLRASRKKAKILRATALSGTGNGDSFLRTNAARTASAIVRFNRTISTQNSLQSAVTEIAGPGGELQKSAEDRWRRTGEGEGGIIGIEQITMLDESNQLQRSVSNLVVDFNCGGMFRAGVTAHGKAVMRAWKPGQHEGLDAYEGEGKEYDLHEWMDENIGYEKIEKY